MVLEFFMLNKNKVAIFNRSQPWYNKTKKGRKNYDFKH